METILRDVAELDRDDRSVLERVVGHPLCEGQRLIIQVTTPESMTQPVSATKTPADLPEWCEVYAGLTDAEIDDLDAAIRERASLSRRGPE